MRNSLPQLVDDFDANVPENELRMRFYNYRDPLIQLTCTEASTCPKDDSPKWDVLHFVRKDFEPALHPRFARVKDNDDVAALLDEKSGILKKTYGEFYAAELVEAQNQFMKTVALEPNIGGNVVGFMSATTFFDTEFVNKEYNLQPFNFLQKHYDHEVSLASRVTQLLTMQAEYPTIEPDNSETENKTIIDCADNNFDSETDAILKAYHEERHHRLTTVSAITLASDEIRSALLSDAFSVDKDMRKIFITSGSWTRRHLRKEYGMMSTENSPRKMYIPDENNAFIIQLYCLLAEFDNRAKDFLPFMFNLFPDIDYAIISVPRLVPETTLLQQFFRVKPRVDSGVTQELYVYHRANLVSDFQVRPAVRDDQRTILKLTNQMHPYDRTLLARDLNNYMKLGKEPDGTELICYVATCMKNIVGVLIARAEKHIDWLRANYDLEDYIYFMRHGSLEFATIIHLLLASSVNSRSRLFLREVMRQAEKTCFFYFIFPPFAMDTRLKLNTLAVCLPELYAVRPRRQIIYPKALAAGEKGPQARMLDCPLNDQPPAVYLISRNLIMEPKLVLNARVVVVGASSTSLAFLETILFASHFRFNNMILLSPRGMPHDTEEAVNERINNFFPPHYLQDRRRMGQISLRTGVSSVCGTLTAIDRNRKLITIDGKHEMSYDFLILAPGTQYHPPVPTGIEPKVYEARRKKNPCEIWKISTKDRASNLFLLNDEATTKAAILYIEKYLVTNVRNAKALLRKGSLQTEHLLEDPMAPENPPHDLLEGPVIVYGDCLDAYACIAGLLDMGVPGIRILLMHPYRKPDPSEIDDLGVSKPFCHTPLSVFDDHTVETAVHKALEDAGVRILRRCVLLHWNSDPTSLRVDEITSVAFIADGRQVRIRCVAFFSFIDKKLDYDFFKAVNDACLVFDKQLVIDTNFHTSDACIRAAGPATKLRRIYYNDRYTHSLCNSLEVGERLAKAFLDTLDPSFKLPKTPAREEHHLMPIFKMPRVVNIKLPGGYHYLRVWRPGYRKNVLLRASTSTFGRSLVTGLPEVGSGYFSIHIDQYRRVSRIVCLSKKSLSVSNYVSLYSTHEHAINHLISRYDEGCITDFYAFFDEPWAMALFHDRFDELKQEIHELGCNPRENGAKALIEQISECQDIEEPGFCQLDIDALHYKYLTTGHKVETEKRVINFIANNNDLLPMYALPDMVKQAH